MCEFPISPYIRLLSGVLKSLSATQQNIPIIPKGPRVSPGALVSLGQALGNSLIYPNVAHCRKCHLNVCRKDFNFPVKGSLPAWAPVTGYSFLHLCAQEGPERSLGTLLANCGLFILSPEQIALRLTPDQLASWDKKLPCCSFPTQFTVNLMSFVTLTKENEFIMEFTWPGTLTHFPGSQSLS